MPILLRPEGPIPDDLTVSRRAFAGLFAAGYAAFARSADAAPIKTDTQGLITEHAYVPEGPGALPAYVARPQAPGRYGAVLVVSEVFGVHEYIRDVCRRLAKAGYVGIAPQFFVRADPQNTLATTQNFTEIQRIVGTAKNAQVMVDVGATLDWLARQPFVDRRRLGVMGFCWGGAVAWMSAAKFPQLKAAVAWYGRLSAPKPGQFMSDDQRAWPLELAGEMRTPVLGLYGGKDQGIPVSDVEAMRTALKAAGRTGSELIVYPDAQHGFHADYRATYNPKDAEDGWARALAFLSAHHLTPGAARGLFGF